MVYLEKYITELFSDPALAYTWSPSGHRCGHSSSEVANHVTII
jgi:hypothetical protein